MNRTTGFTLIELMLALLISSLILCSLSFIYLTCEKNQKTQAALMTIQENSRIAKEILGSAIHTAGYIGCVKLTKHFLITNDYPVQLTENSKMKPYAGNEKKPGSDAFSIIQANTVNAYLIQSMNDYSRLIVSTSLLFEEEELMVISDCKSADIFKIQQVINMGTMQIIIPERPLKKLYGLYAEVGQLENNTYYIAKTDRIDEARSPVYALYKKDIYSRKTEILDGINNMKINYAVSENGQLRQRRGDEINAQSKIVGISIMLELSSLNRVAMNKNVFYYVSLRE